jgi:DNA-binding CsgD family transcriptional regulator
MSKEDAVAAGRAALESGRWAEAAAAFEAALRQDEALAEALLGMGDALFWLGQGARSVTFFERAYAEFRRIGDQMNAAWTAISLSLTYGSDLGNRAAASGWIARAERVLEGLEASPLHGWVSLVRAEGAAEPPLARELATRALEVARQFGDRDLELCALSALGEVLVAMGQVREGFALVDEAMAATFGGEHSRLDTVVFTSCSMMTACEMAADLERATQWSRAANNFMRTYGCPYLHARCRIAYGTVLAATGHWSDAERELSGAVRMTEDGSPAMYSLALGRLAHLRVLQGRFEEAEELLFQADDETGGALPAARIALARGQTTVAVALLQRRLNFLTDESCIETAQVLELLVETHLANGSSLAAEAAADRLLKLALHRDYDLIVAHATRASAQTSIVRGDIESGIAQLEKALDRFLRLQLPWEAARTRLALAKALMHEHPEFAVAEGQRAFMVFYDLGATVDADAAASLLRSLGVSGRTGPKDVGVLTQREQEVLRLLSLGLSNPEIAQRLFISRKTAAHHVSNVLAKLGLRNRAEAVAYAARALKEPIS